MVFNELCFWGNYGFFVGFVFVIWCDIVDGFGNFEIKYMDRVKICLVGKRGQSGCFV